MKILTTLFMISFVVGDADHAVDLQHRSVSLEKGWSGPPADALRRAVGDSQVVLLGELTHGDGTSFRRKAEIVELLHESMGFDVLVWESSLYDCAEMDAALGGDRDLRRVARMGVFSHWAEGAESFPVFEYARATRQTERPLRMAGFDIQGSGTASNSMFPDMLDWFEARPELDQADRAAIASSFDQARAASSAPDPTAARAAAELAVFANAPRFLRAYQANPEVYRGLWGDRATLRHRVLLNAVAYGEMLRQTAEMREGKRPFAEPYNLRERENAANLLWLVREHFRGHKVIVWAHNLHILRVAPATGERQPPDQGGLDSTGRIVGDALGDRAYCLGFLAAGGTWSWLGNPPITFRDPGPDSIEGLLHQTHAPSAFLDLRGLGPDHWLRSPINATLDQQNPLTLRVRLPDAFDGVIYVDSMSPRTPL